MRYQLTNRQILRPGLDFFQLPFDELLGLVGLVGVDGFQVDFEVHAVAEFQRTDAGNWSKAV